MRRKSRQSRGWPSIVWRGALGALVIAGALALALSWTAPRARAAGGCGTTQACIHWSSSMIYAGKNSGYPEGPVGEHVVVNGEGFQTSAGQQITLRLVKGDVNNAPDSPYGFCKLASPRVDHVASATVDSTGAFSANFDWPAAAGSGNWSICAVDVMTGFPSPLGGAGSIDDGPFYVMSSHAPSLTLSSATVNPGGSVTVTGRNWLPAQGDIFVYAGPCADCDGAPLATDNVSSNGSGDFTATLTFGASATPGKYIVSAHNQSGVLDLIMSGPHITVALASTATPAPTATTIPTATTASGGSSSSGGSGGQAAATGLSAAVPWLLGAGGLLALVLLGVGIFFLVRRRPPTTPPGGPRSGPGAPYYPPSATPPAYTPAGPEDATIPIQPPADPRW
ncbi:MAG TPA: hypothetical protein VFQ25_08970 [Ktedonobacterales bacterium]|nr:hypothetical protein [Ktedonobacterales bacterium]